ACDSEALLFRFGEAVQRLDNAADLKKAGDRLWTVRLSLLEADLLRDFLRQYGGRIEEEVVEGQGDSFRRSPGEMQAKIQQGYAGLQSQSELVKSTALESESYFVDVKQADLAVYPTLYDFTVFHWTAYLLREAPPPDQPIVKIPARSYLGDDFTLSRSVR